MGSHPTLNDHELAAGHPQVRTWPDGDPDLAHGLGP
jgi:hypothetical protein